MVGVHEGRTEPGGSSFCQGNRTATVSSHRIEVHQLAREIAKDSSGTHDLESTDEEARDEDVLRFVDYIHTTTKHVSGRGVCGGQWSAARETSQKSASKLDEEGLELAVCRHGVLLCALNMYRGEIFAYPLYLQTKLASRRIDMLTLMAMRWNQQKVSNLATSLSRRYLKTTKALEKQLQYLESMKAELAVTEKQLEDWIRDVNEWAETTTNNPRDAAALASKIEMLTVSVKRRSQRLYKDTDSNKGRSRIRRKIRDEKGVLTATVEKFNSMVPSTEALCLQAILSVEKAWPWQLPNSGQREEHSLVMAVKRLQEEKKILVTDMNHHWKVLSTRSDSLKELSCLQNSPLGLSKDGMKGLQSMFRKKQHDIGEMKTHARRCYLHVLTGAETINFLQSLSDESSDCDSDSSDDTR
ncbi:hypothetical protein JOQ06_022303 [Pogonophryne albipinna]|uniref:Uncharacterized protein n=1 Tax=Pogonophryne albipinna TaxID=1090488 RepID=A0AAD6F573_9TELE|nr:hypothetical protein JOQ06_022303 [Pogonophryne albipinna]